MVIENPKKNNFGPLMLSVENPIQCGPMKIHKIESFECQCQCGKN